MIIIFFSGCTDNETHPGDVKILDIIRIPENPNPGDEITITAFVEDCKKVHLSWDAYFTGGSGNNGMSKKGATEYETKIGPYENGTEVLYMVSAVGYDDTYILSDLYTIQIGEIERSYITSLSISNVLQSPLNPTIEDSYVIITANVSSNVGLMDIRLGYFHFDLDGSGSINMNYVSGDTCEGQIYIGDLVEGATIIYRIEAKDESGNTAVSSIPIIEL